MCFKEDRIVTLLTPVDISQCSFLFESQFLYKYQINGVAKNTTYEKITIKLLKAFTMLYDIPFALQPISKGIQR